MGRTRRGILSVGMAAFLGLLAASAFAAELKTPKQSCTGLNCGATVLLGRLNQSERCCGFDNKSMPWVAQLYANKNECLRLHVTDQATRTELVAVAPGTQRAWRNGSPSPLLKIRTQANEAGWFLVQVNSPSGNDVDAEFTLRYARYAANNRNCNAPSGPLPSP